MENNLTIHTNINKDRPLIYKKDKEIYVPINHPDHINLVRRRLARLLKRIGI